MSGAQRGGAAPDVLLGSTVEWLFVGGAWRWMALLARYDRGHSNRGHS